MKNKQNSKFNQEVCLRTDAIDQPNSNSKQVQYGKWSKQNHIIKCGSQEWNKFHLFVLESLMTRNNKGQEQEVGSLLLANKCQIDLRVNTKIYRHFKQQKIKYIEAPIHKLHEKIKDGVIKKAIFGDLFGIYLDEPNSNEEGSPPEYGRLLQLLRVEGDFQRKPTIEVKDDYQSCVKMLITIFDIHRKINSYLKYKLEDIMMEIKTLGGNKTLVVNQELWEELERFKVTDYTVHDMEMVQDELRKIREKYAEIRVNNKSVVLPDRAEMEQEDVEGKEVISVIKEVIVSALETRTKGLAALAKMSVALSATTLATSLVAMIVSIYKRTIHFTEAAAHCLSIANCIKDIVVNMHAIKVVTDLKDPGYVAATIYNMMVAYFNKDKPCSTYDLSSLSVKLVTIVTTAVLSLTKTTKLPTALRDITAMASVFKTLEGDFKMAMWQAFGVDLDDSHKYDGVVKDIIQQGNELIKKQVSQWRVKDVIKAETWQKTVDQISTAMPKNTIPPSLWTLRTKIGDAIVSFWVIHKTQKERPAPVNLYIEGAPGVGKSYMIPEVAKELSVMYDETFRVYSVPANAKHYPAYNDEEVCVVDEFNKEEKPSDGVGYRDANELTSGASFNMQGAALVEKYQFANFKVCIFASNIRPENVSIGYRTESMDAFWTRFRKIKVIDPHGKFANRDKQTHQKADFSHLEFVEITNVEENGKIVQKEQKLTFRELMTSIADSIMHNQKKFQEKTSRKCVMTRDKKYQIERFDSLSFQGNDRKEIEVLEEQEDKPQHNEPTKHVLYAAGRPAVGKTTRVITMAAEMAERWGMKVWNWLDGPAPNNSMVYVDDFLPHQHAEKFLEYYNKAPQTTKFIVTSNYGPSTGKNPIKWFRRHYKPVAKDVFDDYEGLYRRLGFDGDSLDAKVVVVTQSGITELSTGKMYSSYNLLLDWARQADMASKVKIHYGSIPTIENSKLNLDVSLKRDSSYATVFKTLLKGAKSPTAVPVIKRICGKICNSSNWKLTLVQAVSDEARIGNVMNVRITTPQTTVLALGTNIYVTNAVGEAEVVSVNQGVITLDVKGIPDFMTLNREDYITFVKEEHVLTEKSCLLYEVLMNEKKCNTETWQTIRNTYPLKFSEVIYFARLTIKGMYVKVAAFVVKYAKYFSIVTGALGALALLARYFLKPESYTIENISDIPHGKGRARGSTRRYLKINKKVYYPDDDADFGTGLSKNGAMTNAIHVAYGQGKLRRGVNLKTTYRFADQDREMEIRVLENGQIEADDTDQACMANHSKAPADLTQKFLKQTRTMYNTMGRVVSAVTFIEPMVFVTPRHCIQRGSYIMHEGKKYIFSTMYEHVEREFAAGVLKVPMPGVSNITKLIPSESEMLKVNRASCLKVDTEGNCFAKECSFQMTGHVSPAITHEVIANFTGINGYHVFGHGNHNDFYYEGDCGFPLVAKIDGQYNLVSIHCVNRQTLGGILTVIISQELLKEIYAAKDKPHSMCLTGYSPVPKEWTPNTERSVYFPSRFMDMQEQRESTEKDFQPNGPNFKTVAHFNNNIGMDAHSKKRRIGNSKLDGIFGLLKAPALSKHKIETEWTEKIPATAGKPHAAYIRMSTAEGNTGKQDMPYVIQAGKRVGQYLRAQSSVKVKPLSIREALEGLPNKNIEGLKLNTSPGDPINLLYKTNQKYDFFKREPDGTVTATDKGDELMELINKHWTGAKNNKIFTLPMSGKLKAELLENAKVWKKRIYNVVGIHAVINHRRIFSPVQKFLESQGVYSPFVTSMYPAAEWDSLIKDMLSVGDHFIAIDVKCYDMNVPKIAIQAGGELISAIYDVTEGPLYNQIATYLEELSTMPILIERNLVTRHGGVPSGCSATSLIDGLVLYIMIYDAYCKLRKEQISLEVYETRVKVKTCGDDCLISVSDQDLDFGYFYLKEYFKKIGITVTMSTKDDKKEVDFLPLEECTFVSRYPVIHPQHPDVYLSRLKPQSVSGLLTYSSSGDPDEVLSTLENALIEVFPYGKEKYEETMAATRDFAAQNHLDPVLTTYDAMSHELWKLARGGTGPQFGLNIKQLEFEENIQTQVKREKYCVSEVINNKSILKKIENLENVKKNLQLIDYSNMSNQYVILKTNMGTKIKMPQPRSLFYYSELNKFISGENAMFNQLDILDKEDSRTGEYVRSCKRMIDVPCSAGDQPGAPMGQPQPGPSATNETSVVVDQNEHFTEAISAPAEPAPTAMRQTSGGPVIHASSAGHDGTAIPWAGQASTNISKAYQLTRVRRLAVSTATDYGTVLLRQEFNPWDENLISSYMARESRNHMGFVGFIRLALVVVSHFYNYGALRVAIVPSAYVKKVRPLTGEALIQALEQFQRTEVSLNADARGVIEFRPSMIDMRTLITKDWIDEQESKPDTDPTKQSLGMLFIYTNTRIQNAQGDAKSIEAYIECGLGDDAETRYCMPDDNTVVNRRPPGIYFHNNIVVTDGNHFRRKLPLKDSNPINSLAIDFTRMPLNLGDTCTFRSSIETYSHTGFKPSGDSEDQSTPQNCMRSAAPHVISNNVLNNKTKINDSDPKIRWQGWTVGQDQNVAIGRKSDNSEYFVAYKAGDPIQTDIFVSENSSVDTRDGITATHIARHALVSQPIPNQGDINEVTSNDNYLTLSGFPRCVGGLRPSAQTAPTGWHRVQFPRFTEVIPAVETGVAGMTMLETETTIRAEQDYEEYFNNNPTVTAVVVEVRELDNTILTSLIANRYGFWARIDNYSILASVLNSRTTTYIPVYGEEWPVRDAGGAWSSRVLSPLNNTTYRQAGHFHTVTARETFKTLMESIPEENDTVEDIPCNNNEEDEVDSIIRDTYEEAAVARKNNLPYYKEQVEVVALQETMLYQPPEVVQMIEDKVYVLRKLLTSEAFNVVTKRHMGWIRLYTCRMLIDTFGLKQDDVPCGAALAAGVGGGLSAAGSALGSVAQIKENQKDRDAMKGLVNLKNEGALNIAKANNTSAQEIAKMGNRTSIGVASLNNQTRRMELQENMKLARERLANNSRNTSAHLPRSDTVHKPKDVVSPSQVKVEMSSDA